MNTKLRPYAPSDWGPLCIIHDAARRHELQAAGLADAFLSLEQTADNEGFKILRRADGKLAGNEAFAASGYVLHRNAGKI
jgi:hypothetical protein